MEPATIPPRHGARRAAWIALALALASIVNAIVTAAIVHARDYERFTPAGLPPWARIDPLHQAARDGIARLTIVSCVGAVLAVVFAVGAWLLQRQAGSLPYKPIAGAAIVTAIVAGIIAVGAAIVCDWQLTPWPFG